MNLLSKRLTALLLVITIVLSMIPGVLAAPAANDITTTPTGYTSAADVAYVTKNGYITNWYRKYC
jgi:hypothetical protein